ncbi:hypothetical protein D4764_13G0003640 [Takifugu flavidus]|uniref:Uncharacterized protein n=1 Tax=Takifugu flavidus TaxID=433684 RepID=A0A5C6P7P2_9TELE|nr:hypothetical protein D4764_13G0003640 [Takifugu flavidus]
MESLQQATDGDGQRRNARRYRESDVTPRRYIEDKRGQETSWMQLFPPAARHEDRRREVGAGCTCDTPEGRPPRARVTAE